MSKEKTLKAQRLKTLRLANVLGVAHLLLGGLLLYGALAIWPDVQTEDSIRDGFSLFQIPVTLNYGQRVLLMVLMTGAAGSFLHSANSFIAYAGNSRLTREWVWYYLLRPFLGSTLAMGFYLVVRGGFLTVNGSAESLNLYGIAAISFLAGMNSDQAIKKLIEVFDTLFRTQEADPRGGKLGALAVESIEPAEIKVNTPTTVVIKGRSFAEGVILLVNGKSHDVQRISDKELRVDLTDTDVKEPGELKLVVINPPPNGQTSEVLTIEIKQ
jgi:hypothetical protein